MEFVVLLRQKGEGCDYTIGCGYKYIFIEAKDMDDALYQVRTKNREDYEDGTKYNLCTWQGFGQLEEVTIIPVTQKVDALHFMSEREKREAEEEKRRQEKGKEEDRKKEAEAREKQDREEYERLRNKFEGSN